MTHTQEARHFYVFVRTDLNITQQLVQTAHAAHESGIHLAPKTNPISSIVVCYTTNETELLRAQDYIENRGIKTVLFREPDLNDQATAFATEPIDITKRKFLSKYPLWRFCEQNYYHGRHG